MSNKKRFDKYKDRGIGASKEKLEEWGVKPEELGWDGEEDTEVDELSDGGEENVDEMSWEELKNNPEVANQWYNERVDSPTEEEMLENAGGKWKEEKSQADKIGEAVAKNINQPHQEETETEELEQSSPEPEPSRNKSTSKDLPPKWEKKLKERGNSWIKQEELSSSTDSVLKDVKSKSEVSELSEGRKRIDTSSIRAIAELNSLNQQYPDKVNILKTDRENQRMTAIVDANIKQLID